MTPSTSTKQDISLLNRTLLKLAMPRLILRSAVILLSIIVWAWLIQYILDFGQKQNYAFLASYSQQLVDYFISINKYIWWGIILIGSIVLYFALYHWLSASIEKASTIKPKQAVLEELIPQLSPHAKDVLAWVWNDQREPISLKNLHDTVAELRGNRVRLLDQVKAQRALLGITTEEQDNASLVREKQRVDELLQEIDLDLSSK